MGGDSFVSAVVFPHVGQSLLAIFRPEFEIRILALLFSLLKILFYSLRYDAKGDLMLDILDPFAARFAMPAGIVQQCGRTAAVA